MKKFFSALYETSERFISPFHYMSLGLTFCITLSGTACCTQYLEPVTTVLGAFLITFPLTIGMLIIFLILYNLNWEKVSFIKVMLGPLLFAFLFISLNLFAKAFHLKERGEKIAAEKNEKGHEQPATKSAIVTLQSPQKPVPLDSAVNALTANTGKPVENPGKPWYMSVPVLSHLILGVALLTDIFKEFYATCGRGRFLSGIFLALAFAYLIQRKIINRLNPKEVYVNPLTDPDFKV
ncbi:MAG: hypothetical protein ABUT20_23615 [Bacteroidota bacterium]